MTILMDHRTSDARASRSVGENKLSRDRTTSSVVAALGLLTLGVVMAALSVVPAWSPGGRADVRDRVERDLSPAAPKPREVEVSRDGSRTHLHDDAKRLARKIASRVVVEVLGGRARLQPGELVVPSFRVRADATEFSSRKGLGRLDLRVCMTFSSGEALDGACVNRVIAKNHPTEFAMHPRVRVDSTGDVAAYVDVTVTVHGSEKPVEYRADATEIAVGEIQPGLWSMATLMNLGIGLTVLAALLGAVLTALKILHKCRELRRGAL